MHDPPFRKDWYSEVFMIETNLEIKEVKFLNADIEVNRETDAIILAKKGLKITDYVVRTESRQIFLSPDKSEERTFFNFYPDFTDY